MAGLHGGRLKLRLKAAPRDGEANTELCVYLAREFHVAKVQVTLVSGDSGRDKLGSITAPQYVPDWLRNLQVL